MNILFIESDQSVSFKLYEALKTLGKIKTTLVDIADEPTKKLKLIFDNKVLENDINLIAGTDLGGWYASHIGARAGIPFIAINSIYCLSNNLTMAKNGCGFVRVSEEYKKNGGKEVLDNLFQAYGARIISDELSENPKKLAKEIKEFCENAEIVGSSHLRV